MILAGYETTANALSFALYLIATNKAAEERVVAEVDAFGRGRTPTYDDLERCASLPRTSACSQHQAVARRAEASRVQIQLNVRT